MLRERLVLPVLPVTTDHHMPDVCANAAAAADDLYTSHAPLLRHIAITKFHVPGADADTLVHDVFTTYFTRSTEVRSPRPYLIGAICNAARHYWRDQKTEQAAMGYVALSHPLPQEELLDTLGTKLLIAATLSRLGNKCRDLLRRYYFEGETTAMIAASRETTTDYVLFLLHRCRKQARAIVRSLTAL